MDVKKNKKYAMIYTVMNEIQNSQIFNIPVSQIIPNPYQPRKYFSDESLSSLASSISRFGVLQPIVVTKAGDDKYELIAGERRLRASKIAGLLEIPAIVKATAPSNEEKFELAIIENLHREDLNPVDRAKAFKKLSDEFHFTHSEIAEKLGKSREYISNSLRILSLPDYSQEAIADGRLSEGMTRPILLLKDRPYEQKALFEKIIKNKMTVRAAERYAKNILSGNTITKASRNDLKLKILEKKLAEKLGTKVNISGDGNNGKLVIEFHSDKEIQKMLNLVENEELNDDFLTQDDFLIRKEESNLDNNDALINNLQQHQNNIAEAANSLNDNDNYINNINESIKTEEDKPSVDIDGYHLNFNNNISDNREDENSSIDEVINGNEGEKEIKQENSNYNFLDNNQEIHNFDFPINDLVEQSHNLTVDGNSNIDNSSQVSENLPKPEITEQEKTVINNTNTFIEDKVDMVNQQHNNFDLNYELNNTSDEIVSDIDDSIIREDSEQGKDIFNTTSNLQQNDKNLNDILNKINANNNNNNNNVFHNEDVDIINKNNNINIDHTKDIYADKNINLDIPINPDNHQNSQDNNFQVKEAPPFISDKQDHKTDTPINNQEDTQTKNNISAYERFLQQKHINNKFQETSKEDRFSDTTKDFIGFNNGKIQSNNIDNIKQEFISDPGDLLKDLSHKTGLTND